jgi:hypothetical protein
LSPEGATQAASLPPVCSKIQPEIIPSPIGATCNSYGVVLMVLLKYPAWRRI